MPGFSKGIGTHKVHSVHMTLSFLGSGSPYLVQNKYSMMASRDVTT